MPGATESIKVAVRVRPFNGREVASGAQNIMQVDEARGTIAVRNLKGNGQEEEKAFTFDNVYDGNSLQTTVYNTIAKDIVDAALSGFNGTIFVYGQTGTGKTFTMEGIRENKDLRGIIPNTFEHIFSHIARTPHKQFLVRVSNLEIYNEEIRDLLVANSNGPGSKKKSGAGLELKEHPDRGVYVKDLTTQVVTSVEEMEYWMNTGHKQRSVGATLMNEKSSRSHSIFTITVECCEKMTMPTLENIKEEKADTDTHIYVGKLNLVDLAGSERQSKTGATGDRLKEATKINLSLSALGNCISALVDGKSTHIPYRDSKLTRLLQDSLGGNSKTLMIATLGPAEYNYEESLSTLRYANRAKNIKNQPKINEDPKDALLRQYQEEINLLRAQLEQRLGLAVAKRDMDPEAMERQRQQLLEQKKKEAEERREQRAREKKLRKEERDKERAARKVQLCQEKQEQMEKERLERREKRLQELKEEKRRQKEEEKAKRLQERKEKREQELEELKEKKLQELLQQREKEKLERREKRIQELLQQREQDRQLRKEQKKKEREERKANLMQLKAQKEKEIKEKRDQLKVQKEQESLEKRQQREKELEEKRAELKQIQQRLLQEEASSTAENVAQSQEAELGPKDISPPKEVQGATTKEEDFNIDKNNELNEIRQLVMQEEEKLGRQSPDFINQLKAEMEGAEEEEGKESLGSERETSAELDELEAEAAKEEKEEEEEESEEEESEEDEDEEEEEEEEQEANKSLILPASQFAGISPEELSKMQEAISAEKKALLSSKGIALEEKQRISTELEMRAAEVEKERKLREDLETKLKEMEGQLIVGGINIMDQLNAQEQEIETAKQLLQDQQRKEQELKQQLEGHQEVKLYMEEEYATLQEEAESKTKKIKKLWTKLQYAKNEIMDIQDEFRTEREDLLDTIRELSREMSFRATVTESMIPEEERQKIEQRAMYDEETDDWKVQLVAELNLANRFSRPMISEGAWGSSVHFKRPTSLYAKHLTLLGEASPRHRHDNILTLKLDMPGRTTRDYEDPPPEEEVSELAQLSFTEQGQIRLLDNSLAYLNTPYLRLYLNRPPGTKKEDLSEDASTRGISPKPPKSARPTSSARRKGPSGNPKSTANDIYPESRNLVTVKKRVM